MRSVKLRRKKKNKTNKPVTTEGQGKLYFLDFLYLLKKHVLLVTIRKARFY